jgi:kynurenine formamidase
VNELTQVGGRELEQFAGLFRGFELVDLSATLENDIPRWPTHPPLIIHKTIYHEHDGYFTNTLFMPEHTGTHIDAPAHVLADRPEQTVDTYPLDVVMGPAVVIDLAPLKLEAGETAGPEVILEWEAANGPIRPGDIALFHFGWLARHWRTDGQWTYYVKNSPGLTGDAVKLLHERGIKALGSDLVACDQAIVDGVQQKSYAHEVYMLPNRRPLIEELMNLDKLPPRCFFLALPLKIKGGSGSPVRPVALVPRG